MSFRRGIHMQHDTQMIVKVDSVNGKDKASSLVGKQIVWTSPAGKEIKGQVLGAHGNKGAFRVKFEKGMPGQSVSTKVKVA